MSTSTEPTATTRPARRWFRRRSVPLPTWRTWLAVLVAAGGLAFWALRAVHPWLCLTAPETEAPYAAVEGWAPDYVMAAAGAHADDADVRLLFTTGPPIERGAHLSDCRDYATLAARTLVALGYEAKRIAPVPSGAARTERTRAMAEALRDALAAENIPAAERRLTIFTLGTHARRTRRLYQEVLGPAWRVGVVSVENRSYDPAAWHRSSEGVKSVISELAALLTQ